MRRDKISETELCAKFIAIANDCGWTAYPEFADFDIVLVRDGLQIGVHAKLRFNATLPDYVPDVAAGASAPIRLTPWKIGALKVCATMEIRGHVDKLDFKRHGIDRRRWIAARWIVPMPVTVSRSKRDSTLADDKAIRYVYGPKPPVFPLQHPVVYEQIKAEVLEWMREFENQA